MMAVALISALLICAVATASESPGPKVYVILEITVNDPVMYEQYREAVEPIIVSHGGRYVVRSGARSFDNDPNSEVVSPEGQWYPDRIIVLEFNSKAQIQSFVNSPEYKAIVHFRHDSASTKMVVVNGYRGSP